MKRKDIKEYNGNFFTWTDNVGVADQSEFEARGAGGPIYDDACDYGFNVIGNHSNILFTFIGNRPDDFGGVDMYDSDCGMFHIHIYNT